MPDSADHPSSIVPGLPGNPIHRSQEFELGVRERAIIARRNINEAQKRLIETYTAPADEERYLTVTVAKDDPTQVYAVTGFFERVRELYYSADPQKKLYAMRYMFEMCMMKLGHADREFLARMPRETRRVITDMHAMFQDMSARAHHPLVEWANKAGRRGDRRACQVQCEARWSVGAAIEVHYLLASRFADICSGSKSLEAVAQTVVDAIDSGLEPTGLCVSALLAREWNAVKRAGQWQKKRRNQQARIKGSQRSTGEQAIDWRRDLLKRIKKGEEDDLAGLIAEANLSNSLDEAHTYCDLAIYRATERIVALSRPYRN